MPQRIDAPTRVQAVGTKPKPIDEYTVVLRGMLRVEHRDGALVVRAGQAAITRRGELRYGTPEPDGAEYLAVCLPAFSPDTVHRDV